MELLFMMRVMILGAIYELGATRSIRACTERSEEDLQNMLNQHASDAISNRHATHLILPQYRPAITGHLANSTGKSVSNAILHHRRHLTDLLQNKATCPWMWRENFDNDRYPRLLPEAHCIRKRCKGCSSTAEFACHDVPFHLPVLRRGDGNTCDNGYYIYELSYQTISVGCTCVAVPSA